MADLGNLMFRLGLNTKDFDKQMQDELQLAKKTADEIKKMFADIKLPQMGGKGGKGGAGGGADNDKLEITSDLYKKLANRMAIVAEQQKKLQINSKFGYNGQYVKDAIDKLEQFKEKLQSGLMSGSKKVATETMKLFSNQDYALLNKQVENMIREGDKYNRSQERQAAAQKKAQEEMERQKVTMGSLVAQYNKLTEAVNKVNFAQSHTNKSGVNAGGALTNNARTGLLNAQAEITKLINLMNAGGNVSRSQIQVAMEGATRAIRESSTAIQQQRAINTEAQRAQMSGQAQILARQRAINAAQAENARLIARSNSHFSIMRNLVGQVGSMMGMYFSVYALQNFISDLVRIRGEFDMQYTALKAILQSGQQASELFSQLKTLAPISPYQFKDLATYAKQLSAYSIPYNELFDTTKRLADLSSGLGVDFYRIVLAYGQVRSAAVLRGQELRQFTEAGIPMVDELAKKFTKLKGEVVSAGDVFELISERQVPFQMVKEVIDDLTNEGGKFYMMQEKQSETLKGKVSNLADRYDIMMNSLGEANDGVLKGTVDMLASIMEHANLLVNAIEKLAVLWGTWKLATLAQTTAMGQNVSTIVTQEAALKRKQALLLRETALYRQLTAEEKAAMAARGVNTGMFGGTFGKGKLSSAEIGQLSLNERITKDQTLRLALLGRINQATMQELVLRGRITQEEANAIANQRLKLAMQMRTIPMLTSNIWGLRTISKFTAGIASSEKVVNGILTARMALYRGMAGLMSGLGAIFSPANLIIGGATAALTAYFDRREEIQQMKNEAQSLADAIKEQWNDVQKFINDHPIEIAIKGGESMMQEYIKQYSEELHKILPQPIADTQVSNSILGEDGKPRSTEDRLKYLQDMAYAAQEAELFVKQYNSSLIKAADEEDSWWSGGSIIDKFKELSDAFTNYNTEKGKLDAADILNRLENNTGILGPKIKEAEELRKVLRKTPKDYEAIYQTALKWAKVHNAQEPYKALGQLGLGDFDYTKDSMNTAYQTALAEVDDVIKNFKKRFKGVDIDWMSQKGRDAFALFKQGFLQDKGINTSEAQGMYNALMDFSMYGTSDTSWNMLANNMLGGLSDASKEAVRKYQTSGIWSDGMNKALQEAKDKTIAQFPWLKETLEKEWNVPETKLHANIETRLNPQLLQTWQQELLDITNGEYKVQITAASNIQEALKAIEDKYKETKQFLHDQKPLMIKIGYEFGNGKTWLDKNKNNGVPRYNWLIGEWEGTNTTVESGLATKYNQAEQEDKAAKELIKRSLIQDHQLNGSGNKDNKKDKVTEQLQKTYDSQKKALQKFNELRKTVSDETAKGIIKKDYGIELQDSWLSQFGQLELIATTLGKLGNRATDAAKNFRKSLNDEKSALLADKDIFGYSVVAENLSKDVELLEKRFKVYDDFFKKSGNANISALIAFGDQTKPYKDIVAATKAEFQKALDKDKGNNLNVEDLLGMSDEDIKQRLPEKFKATFDKLKTLIANGNENARSLLETVLSKTDDEDVKIAVNNANKEELLNSLSSLLFGDTKELSAEQQAKLNELRPMIEDYYNNLNKELTLEKIKKSMNWEELFGDIGSLGISQLDMLISQLEKIVAANNDLDPQKMKEWVSQLNKLKEQRAKLEPFKGLFAEYKNIRSTRKNRDSIAEQIKAMTVTKDYQAAQEKGDTKAKEELGKTMVTLNDKSMTYAEALAALTNATEAYKKAQTSKTKSQDWLMKAGNNLFGLGFSEDFGNFASIVDVINSNVQSMDEFRKKLGIDDDTVVGKATSSLAALSSGVSSAVQSAMSGDVFGVLNGIYDGFLNAGTAIFGGADYTSYENMVEEYGKLIDVWDILIDRKKEYLEEGYTEEIERTAKEIEELYSAEEEAQRTLGKERLNSGASAGSHSIGIRIRNGMSSEGWAQLAEWAGGTNTELYKKVSEGRMTGLFDLSAEQLKELQETAPVFWAKLDGDVQEYLNKIIEIGDAWKDAQEEQKEWWTQTDVDSLIDGFASALDSMDDQTKTFANNFTKTLRAAIINAILQSSYFKNGMEAWRDKFYEYMSDGDLSDFEINDLKNGKLTYTDDDGNTYTVNGWNGLAEYADNVQDKLKQLGLYADQTSGSLSGSIQSITEETADLLASYVNAIRADVAFIRSYYAAHFADDNSQMQDVVTTISVAVAQIQVNTQRSADNTDEIIDLINAVTKTTSTGKALRVS